VADVLDRDCMCVWICVVLSNAVVCSQVNHGAELMEGPVSLLLINKT
jgi:hypothetical protein